MKNPLETSWKWPQISQFPPKINDFDKFQQVFLTFMMMIEKFDSTREMTLFQSLFWHISFCDSVFLQENAISSFLQISPHFCHFLDHEGKKCPFSSKECRKVFWLFSRVILNKTLEITVSQRFNAHPRAYHFNSQTLRKVCPQVKLFRPSAKLFYSSAQCGDIEKSNNL